MHRKFIPIILILVDASIVTIAPCLSMLTLFFGSDDSLFFKILHTLPVVIFLRLSVFYGFGLYHRLWQYASIDELIAIIGSVTVSSIFIYVYMLLIGNQEPISMYILTWSYSIFLVGASRLFVRLLQMFRQKTYENRAKILIIGAGDAGAMIAREIRQRYYDSKQLIGFIDDDPNKKNKSLFGVKVLGAKDEIGEVVRKHNVDEIIIALPSVSGLVYRELLQGCLETKCIVKTVPALYELIDGKVTVRQLRDVSLEDLLRRDPVQLDIGKIAKYLAGKRVLVTGAGGSIGSELCRQIAKVSPAALYLLGKGENSIYYIHRELRGKYPKLHIEPIIADIRDRERINAVFSREKPQVIFHAAAHKHVPLMELQPEEAIKNNVFGTKIIAEAADRYQAEIFIMISTDKAVNPTSVMGVTKRVAEMIVQNLNSISTTKFATVRFGNVLGSRGSVVPLFRGQIAAGGPVTITHPEMRRYFMTIPEAVQLVLQAGAMAEGGEVFVLDMGEPVAVLDMACDLIRLSGLEPYRDIPIEFTGIRAGEKLSEELMTAEEGTTATRHAKIFVANLKTTDQSTLEYVLSHLREVTQHQDIKETLGKLVPTYRGILQQDVNRKNLIKGAEDGDPAAVSLH